MEKEVNAKKMEAAKAALEKANKEAGYDVPLAFAALNTVIINAQMRMDFPRFERETAAATIADVVVRAYGGKLDVNAIGTIVEAGIAYGWHRAMFGENPFSSGRVLDQLIEFINKNEKMTIEEKMTKKEGMNQGYIALQNAVKKTESVAKLHRAIKK